MLWVAIGQSSGRTQLNAAVGRILSELEAADDGQVAPAVASPLADKTKGSAAAGGATDQFEALRRALERRRVLVIFDDLAGRLGAETPALAVMRAAHFPTLAAIAPATGQSRILVTTRDLDECCLFFTARGVAVSHALLRALPLRNAAALIEHTAGLRGLHVDSSALEGLAEATGRSPLALQIVAGALRSELEQISLSGSPDAVHAASCAAKLSIELSVAMLPCGLLTPANAPYAPVFRAISALFAGGFALCDVNRFATFGIFPEDAHIPTSILAAAWRMCGPDDARRADGIISTFEAMSLLKRGRPGCVQLHDLPWEYACALLRGRVPGRAQEERERAAHANFLERLIKGELLPNSDDAWHLKRRDVLAGGAGCRETLCYIGAEVLSHMRKAGDGIGARNLLFSLPFIMFTVDTRGGAAACDEADAQARWESTHGGTDEAAYLLSVLRMSSAALIYGGDALPSQICGRLTTALCEGRPLLLHLLSAAASWTGNSRGLWLRPSMGSLKGPHVNTNVWHHGAGNISVRVLGDGRVISASCEVLRVWDSTTGVLLAFQGLEKCNVGSIRILSTGHVVYSVSQIHQTEENDYFYNYVYIWDPETNVVYLRRSRRSGWCLGTRWWSPYLVGG